MNAEEFGRETGIFITGLVPPEAGWVIVCHCPECKVTEIVVSPYAIKPSDGDFWIMRGICHTHLEHNFFKPAKEPYYTLRGDKQNDESRNQPL